MRTFDEILNIAAERKGGIAAVMAQTSAPKTVEALAATPDDRWLSMMARSIFQAGFSWKVIETKWPGIEEAFGGFEIGPIAFMADDYFDRLMGDKRIIRNGAKVRAIHENAIFIQDVARDAGSFGRKIADWPAEDYVGLLQWLSKKGSRLGGTTGQYMLRTMGKESFIFSRDVVARLQAEGVIDGSPTSQRALRAAQAAFDQWRAESGQSFNVISRVLAMSVG